MNEFPLLNADEGLPLFYPHMTESAKEAVLETLSGRWIGQGPKVELFESSFKKKFLGDYSALAVGSGTDALHLSYLLADIKKDDEVLVPTFTCTATNIPLLYIGAKIKFLDIDPETLNISIEDLKNKITEKTRAVVCVDYGGIPCDYEELNKICKAHNVPLIADAAHSLGSKYMNELSGTLADFTIFSFQAIKTLTTGDGGLISIKNEKLVDKARRLRWFGIDRAAKQKGIWENDITEIGFKYQMNDISASIGIAGLKEIDAVISHRNKIFKVYEENLKSTSGVRVVGRASTEKYFNSAWLMTVLVEKNRFGLMKKLRDKGIESAQVHYRNDKYSIFAASRASLPNMDEIEDKYLVLPLHTRMVEADALRVCDIINLGF